MRPDLYNHTYIFRKIYLYEKVRNARKVMLFKAIMCQICRYPVWSVTHIFAFLGAYNEGERILKQVLMVQVGGGNRSVSVYVKEQR